VRNEFEIFIGIFGGIGPLAIPTNRMEGNVKSGLKGTRYQDTEWTRNKNQKPALLKKKI
jgi:hypothetical protein